MILFCLFPFYFGSLWKVDLRKEKDGDSGRRFCSARFGEDTLRLSRGDPGRIRNLFQSGREILHSGQPGGCRWRGFSRISYPVLQGKGHRHLRPGTAGRQDFSLERGIQLRFEYSQDARDATERLRRFCSEDSAAAQVLGVTVPGEY